MPRRDQGPSLQDRLSAAGAELRAVARKPNHLRYDPHDKQVEFHASPAKHRLFLGGNRSGKSVAGTEEGIQRALGQHRWRQVPPAPTWGRVVGTDFPNGIEKVLLPMWAQWLPPSALVDGSWEDSFAKQDRVLSLANGSKVEFMSYEQDVQKFAGASRDWVHFDEEPPRSVYDECRARLIDVDGVWWMTLTPVLGLDYIYDDVYMPGKRWRGEFVKTLTQAGLAAAAIEELLHTPREQWPTPLLEAFAAKAEPMKPDLAHPLFGVVEVETGDNRHLPMGSAEEFFGSLKAELRQMRQKGQFVQVQGAVFPEFDKGIHVIGEFDWQLDLFGRGDRVYVSIDHGWRDDTAVLWHAVSPDGSVVTFDELYVNHTLTRDIARMILERNSHHGIRRPFIYVGDPAMKNTNATTGTSTVQEFARNGVPIAVEGVSRDVEHGVQLMTQYLTHLASPDPNAHSDVVSPPMWRIIGVRCPNLTRQMESIRWKRRPNRSDELELNKLVKIQDKDNHATDSARFFFVLMPELKPEAPRRTGAGLTESQYSELAATFGARPADGRPKATRPKAPDRWSYAPADARDYMNLEE